MATIKILDHNSGIFKSYKVLIDTLGSAFWLISSFCNSEICNQHNKYTPLNNLIGEATIELNNGKLKGNIYVTSVNLNSFVLSSQTIFLVNSLQVSEFENSKFDGVLGISKFESVLNSNLGYTSTIQNILKRKLPSVLIIRLGGSNPYLKFGVMNRADWQYFKDDKYSFKYTEKIEWLNLIEKGKLVLPLRHIKFIYRDSNNNITKTELAVQHCIHHGCRATLDTKSYYIYGPDNQLRSFNDLKAPDCSQKYFKNLPDIEFSFYDVTSNEDKTKHITGLTVDLTLEPEDYMINKNENEIDDGRGSGMDCVAGIGDHGTQFGWNFGIMFLKKFVILYDFENDRLGFVRANNELN